jgi:hypothetical protein
MVQLYSVVVIVIIECTYTILCFSIIVRRLMF